MPEIGPKWAVSLVICALLLLIVVREGGCLALQSTLDTVRQSVPDNVLK